MKLARVLAGFTLSLLALVALGGREGLARRHDRNEGLDAVCGESTAARIAQVGGFELELPACAEMEKQAMSWRLRGLGPGELRLTPFRREQLGAWASVLAEAQRLRELAPTRAAADGTSEWLASVDAIRAGDRHSWLIVDREYALAVDWRLPRVYSRSRPAREARIAIEAMARSLRPISSEIEEDRP